MYCKNCGKELSDRAEMCPSCGEPMGVNRQCEQQHRQVRQASAGVDLKALSIVSLVLGAISFLVAVAYSIFFFVTNTAVVLLYIISAAAIIPALAGLSVGIYVLMTARPETDRLSKPVSIASVVLTSVVLFALFVVSCIIVIIF